VGEDFGEWTLPYGVFSVGDDRPRVGVAVGRQVLDLAPLLGPELFDQPVLNPFLATGRPQWTRTRQRIRELLTDRGTVRDHLIPLDTVRTHLPVECGEFVDFYSSLDHAVNASRILRPGTEPLQPNWRHLPVGYHGRSGTVVVSGTGIRRPLGQTLRPGDERPELRASEKLDIEAEVGFVVGAASEPGTPVPVDRFVEHVFGVVLLIDWSARDIQAYEYVPLGPFLGKSFGTSVSPWVVPLEALETARVDGPVQDPRPLPYLCPRRRWGLDLRLEVELNGHVVSRPTFAHMYWTPDQQLAHMTVNGAHARTGDIYGSGTVSGADPGEYGSLLELSWNGERPLRLPDGTERGFLADADRLTVRATAPGPDGGPAVVLGSVGGTVLPAQPVPRPTG
jgi:fumarylacetoacetase